MKLNVVLYKYKGGGVLEFVKGSGAARCEVEVEVQVEAGAARVTRIECQTWQQTRCEARRALAVGNCQVDTSSAAEDPDHDIPNPILKSDDGIIPGEDLRRQPRRSSSTATASTTPSEVVK